MKITFLGTGGAQGIPSPYCNCSTCMHARKMKGKNIRKRSSYFINDDLVVDMGPDFFTSTVLHGVNMFQMKYVLITHSHLDHFFVQNLGMRADSMHKNRNLPQLTFVAPPSVMMLLNQYTNVKLNLDRYPILPGEKIDLKPYKIKAIRANHYQTVGDAVNYIIENESKKIMIASDTAMYKEEVFREMANAELDLLIIECTRGPNPKSNQSHLNIKDLNQVIQKMKSKNAITRQTKIYGTHFSHNHCPPHDEMSELLKEINVHCSYDGLELEI